MTLLVRRRTAIGDQAASLTAAGPIACSPGTNLVTNAASTWKADQVREPGQVIQDPNPSVSGRTWLFPYSGGGSSIAIGMAFSTTGAEGTWTDYASNPVFTLGEDPYIVKDIRTGLAYRDGSNQLHLFCESKTAGQVDSQFGINHYTSTDAVTWTADAANPVISPGTASWESQDRTSPIVFYDGTQFTLLYEGRGATSDGQVGIARKSTPNGTGWTHYANNPIVIRSGAAVATPGHWRNAVCVPDDLYRIGSKYVLLCHGQDAVGGLWTSGRLSTTQAPADWTETSFVEAPGNPIDAGSNSNVMGVGPDGTKLIRGNLAVSSFDFATVISAANAPVLSVRGGLARWYDASAITGLTDGTAVASWADRLGAGAATQATSTKRPLYKTGIINSLPVVRFDGTDDFLLLPSVLSDAAMSVFMVLRKTAVGSGYATALRMQRAQILARMGTAGDVWGCWENVEVSSGVTLGTTATQISYIQRAFNDVDLVTNGTLLNKTTGTAYPVTEAEAIGAVSAGTQATPMDLGELLVYNRVLSTTERQAVESYLKTKWATP